MWRFLFSENFSPVDFLSKKQCKNSLDNLYCFFFLKHILALTPEHQIGQYKVKPIEL